LSSSDGDVSVRPGLEKRPPRKEKMAYKIKLDFFQGPLDLLLFLIKRDKIDIYDIPISDITRQYIEYLELMKLLDLEVAGEFLVMAATLMHIKSKMLLPEDPETENEEEEADPREELVRKLLEYKKFKDAAEKLHHLQEKHREMFLREGDGGKALVMSNDFGDCFEASLFDLINAFRKVLKGVPKESFHKVIRNQFTVSDKIHEIYHMLTCNERVLFSDLFKNAGNKDEVIATFLAVLELMKIREILAVQRDFFSEIEIVRNPDVARDAVQN
jgi:segregation and condensation protein A